MKRNWDMKQASLLNTTLLNPLQFVSIVEHIMAIRFDTNVNEFLLLDVSEWNLSISVSWREVNLFLKYALWSVLLPPTGL